MTHEESVAWMGRQIDEAERVRQAVRHMVPILTEIAIRMADVLREGRKIIFFGNGGSAADAQHWAAELSGRFYLDRASLPALALSTNTSQLTAIGNDYGFDQVFSRPLAGLGRNGDMAVAISTSGTSKNVVKALEEAQRRNLISVAMTGESGGEMHRLCDYLISIPSDDVARIQEGHELCAHLIFSVVERTLFEASGS